jgi:hypothetical protein
MFLWPRVKSHFKRTRSRYRGAACSLGIYTELEWQYGPVRRLALIWTDFMLYHTIDRNVVVK